MNTDATWQAKEGAILGIYSLVKLFQGGIHDLNDSADDSVINSLYVIHCSKGTQSTS